LIALGLGVLGWFLHRELQHYSYGAIVPAARELPVSSWIWGGLLTVVSYALLIGYDVVALACLKRKVGWMRTSFASFTAFVVTNNVGLGALGSGAVRLRLYGA